MTPQPSLSEWKRGYATANRVLVVVLASAVAMLAALRLQDGRLSVPVFGWRIPETCLVRRQFGRPCAGCGLTRSVVALLHGDWAESRRWHPQGGPVLAFCLVQIVLRSLLANPSRAQFWPADVVLTAAGLLWALGPLL